MRVRVTKTKSKQLAVQVVYVSQSKTKVVKHLGTAHNKIELAKLKRQGEVYIENNLGIKPLFPEFSKVKQRNELASVINSLEFTVSRHTFAYDILHSWYNHVGFGVLNNPLLRDLVLMRLIEPGSKMKAIASLSANFGISYSLTQVYREIPSFRKYQEQVEAIAVAYATANYSFSFSLVFYDVSTLYFESFTESELAKCGYSKDHKHNQPQIVIGLLVNELGFPIAYNLFSGNTFEGKTMIPTLKKLCESHQIKTLTVVADAGMLSQKNIDEVIKSGFSYIVGARLGKTTFEKATILHDHFRQKNNQGSCYSEESGYGTFIADYSPKRAKKDKRDREKQIERANTKLKDSTATKATKFVRVVKKASYALNKKLIQKAELMEGIKGYYTNLDTTTTDPHLIINRYHDLWHVEAAFRMTKSDLLARPIYHFKKESIEAHLLIVFMSLCLGKSLELTLNLSLAKIVSTLWEIEDITLTHPKTHDSYTKRTTKMSSELKHLLAKLKTAY